MARWLRGSGEGPRRALAARSGADLGAERGPVSSPHNDDGDGVDQTMERQSARPVLVAVLHGRRVLAWNKERPVNVIAAHGKKQISGNPTQKSKVKISCEFLIIFTL